jgi:phosphopantothenoylcysteine decarboxylase/phosphopantothenate--cysteine ligase
MSATANPLANRTVVVCVTGGIAAYKAAELVRLLAKAGARVRAAMTPAACEFLGPMTLQALTGEPVATNLFDLTQESEIGHIQVADGADLVIVAPATANAIARFAAGLANDIVAAVLLATRAPILLAPAMNVNMWKSSVTQVNLRRLQARDMHVVGPGEGFLACRWTGPGRMAEPDDIVEAACRVLTPQDLAERTIVVTAGPTHEPLDPVRYLANRSSGRMGYALARAAAQRGAAVTLVSGPVGLVAPVGVTVRAVKTARDMEAATRAAAAGADAVLMAAAVADFRPAEVAAHKRKKSTGQNSAVPLVANPDILAALGAERAARGDGRPVLVGFAAETESLADYARAKLAEKRCDLVVANDVSQADAGFEVDTNRVLLVSAEGARALPLAAKTEIAHRILDEVVARLRT